MSQDRLTANLKRLCSELTELVNTAQLDARTQNAGAATNWSRFVPLSHAANHVAFSGICERGEIVSSQRLHEADVRPLRTGAAEVLLGTHDNVFFYVAPFRYPHTVAGLLFAPEMPFTEPAVATPFDSGGLIDHLDRPSGAEDHAAFLARHELPVPAHREYLCLTLQIAFAAPADYVDGRDPVLNPPKFSNGRLPSMDPRSPRAPGSRIT